MQCIENPGCFPRGKRATIARRYIASFFGGEGGGVGVLCAACLCVHATGYEADSFTTDGYGIFNVSTHLSAWRLRGGGAGQAQTVHDRFIKLNFRSNFNFLDRISTSRRWQEDESEICVLSTRTSRSWSIDWKLSLLVWYKTETQRERHRERRSWKQYCTPLLCLSKGDSRHFPASAKLHCGVFSDVV